MNKEYVALYRKLRPRQFCDIIGQEHIVQTLTNQIKHNRIYHAYLFCGTKGTGKTSTAKVFAKALNCEDASSFEPCLVCPACIDANDGTSLDIIEIDAASNNGVDNIRDLIEALKYAPKGKFKIYIIDEVHMLSLGAFNALLKTLEEPPAACVFILATTDPQKIPPTILSRVIQFDFHRIEARTMAHTLNQYMQTEGILIDFDALEYVAELADGGLRDALSILDRAYSLFLDRHIKLGDIQELLHLSSDGIFLDFSLALASKNTKDCINIIELITKKGQNIPQFIIQYLKFLRNVLVDYDSEKYKKITSKITQNEIIRLIYDFAKLSGEVKNSYSVAKILLEILCITYCKAKPAAEPVAEERLRNASAMTATPAPKPAVAVKYEKSVPNDILHVLSEWGQFCNSFESSFSPFMQKTLPGYLEDNYLYIICDNQTLEDLIKAKMPAIEQQLKQNYNKEFALNIIKKQFYDERHKAKYGADDSFAYKNTELEKLKSLINFDVEIIV